MKSWFLKRTFIIVLISVAVTSAFAADWPQWRGIDRNGQSYETGLLKEWPVGGPKVLWSVKNVGKGNSSVSVAEGVVYITGNKEKTEYLTALDLKGNIKWQKPYGKAWNRSYPEARTTAAIDNDRAYLITGMGEVVCLAVKTGDKIWSRDTLIGKKDYGSWGVAESPLIVDNKIIHIPGCGETTMIAYDKKDGKEIWKTRSLGDKAAYCSPICIETGGKKIIIASVQKNIIGVDASDGNILWSYDVAQYQKKIRGIIPNTPIYHDGSVFITGGYNMGGVKLNISKDGTSVKKAWFSEDLDTHIGGVVLVDGYLYGANWHSNKMGHWLCVDWETGKTVYDVQWHNKGQIISADGMLYCYDEKEGNLGITRATPKGFKIVSSFRVPGKGVHWMHPVISDGVLYVRHKDVLTAYDIKAEK